MGSTVAQRIQKLKRWFEGSGVLFAGYEMFRNLVQGKRLRGKSKDLLKKYLLDPGKGKGVHLSWRFHHD